VRAGARAGNFVGSLNTVLGADRRPVICPIWRREHRDQRQYRRWNHHLQLRRRDQEQHRDRRRRLIGSDSQLVLITTVARM
jgi:hypothetical protein